MDIVNWHWSRIFGCLTWEGLPCGLVYVLG